MKKFALLSCLLALSSVPAFAQTDAIEMLAFASYSSNEPLPAAQAKAVLEALSARMAETTLACTSATGTYKTSPDARKAIADYVIAEGLKVYVNGNAVQPVLSVVWTSLPFESTLKVTTSANYKDIREMHAVQEEIVTSRVNVGTILDPRWEERKVRTVKIEASCLASK